MTTKRKKKMKGEWTYAALWLNVLLIGVVGCGGEATSTSGGTQSELLEDVRPDAEVQQVSSNLNAAERQMLLRAKGREWDDWEAADVRRFFTAHPDTSSMLYMWDPVTKPGAPGLQTVLDALADLRKQPFRVAVAVTAGGDEQLELLALRESQTVLTAVRVPTETLANTGLIAPLKPGNVYLQRAGSEQLLELAPGSDTARVVAWATGI